MAIPTSTISNFVTSFENDQFEQRRHPFEMQKEGLSSFGDPRVKKTNKVSSCGQQGGVMRHRGYLMVVALQEYMCFAFESKAALKGHFRAVLSNVRSPKLDP